MWVKDRELVSGFTDLVCASAVWVSDSRNCVTIKDFVNKKFNKTVIVHIFVHIIVYLFINQITVI